MNIRHIVVIGLLISLSACAGGPRRPGAKSSTANQTLADRCVEARQRGIADPACPATGESSRRERERLPAPAIEIPRMPAPFPAGGPGGLPGDLRR